MSYRCFCMTEDGRIITGAFIETSSTVEAVSAANRLWQHVSKFHHTAIWLDDALLYPSNAESPIQGYLDAAVHQGISFTHVAEAGPAAP